MCYLNPQFKLIQDYLNHSNQQNSFRQYKISRIKSFPLRIIPKINFDFRFETSWYYRFPEYHASSHIINFTIPLFSCFEINHYPVLNCIFIQ